MSDSCNFCDGQECPSHFPKPTCRLTKELKEHENCVTKVVIRDIIKRREENGDNIPCPMKRIKERV